MLVLVIFVLVNVSVFPTVNADPIKVVTTNSVLADFAEQLLGSEAEVDFIMPAGACPTQFDTRPSDVGIIEDADIVISLGIEPWLDSLITASGNDDATKIVCSNFGPWNLPSGAKKFVDKIAAGLADALPEMNSTILASAVSFKTEIDTKAAELLVKVEDSGLGGKQVVSMEWQKDFIEWLGFEVISYYPPPESLSTADVLSITGTIGNNNVVAIIDNLQSGTEFGANIAAETGVAHVIFTNFPGAIPGTETYLEMIDYNTDRLIDGIETFEQTDREIASLELQRTVLLVTAIIFALLSVVLSILYIRKR